ncbi:hypothetical protein QR680_013798 [Steinernema hermaphroditum]|uniref:Uncharacterized protein n=1 Tax=Steinernema hermaphroditum TaxID=289476 RepID=A0AA39I6Q6_9BILA|nr:hypothetical protein QR680_013798 [Steinernema hermaphroditum]
MVMTMAATSVTSKLRSFNTKSMLLAFISAKQTSALFYFRSKTSSERVIVIDATLIFSELTLYPAPTRSRTADARFSVVSNTVFSIPSIRCVVPETISVPSSDQMDQEQRREDKNLPHCFPMEWLLCGTGHFYI